MIPTLRPTRRTPRHGWLASISATAAIVVSIGSPGVRAQQPLSSFDALWSRVKSGDVVFVTDSQAQETTGIFVKVSASTLSLLVDGQLRDQPLGDIRVLARNGDSVRNGFLIGAGFGAVAGALAFGSDCGALDGPCLPEAVGGAIADGLFFGGAGALIDFLIKGRTVVYRAPIAGRIAVVPIVTPGRQGVRVALRVQR